jgi:predicted MPP superfamily phosphohydrolase
MSLLIIHLSDIHLDEGARGFLARAKQIVDAAFSEIQSVDGVHIVVSGDITSRGTTEDAGVAVEFLSDLARHVKNRVDLQADFILVPGNHDCDFSGDQSVRNILVQSIRKSADLATDSIARTLSEVQSGYRSVEAKFCRNLVPISEWAKYIDTPAPESIRYVLLNSAVLSVIKEEIGKLILPIPKQVGKRQPVSPVFLI